MEKRGTCVTVLDPHVSTRDDMGRVVITVNGAYKEGQVRLDRDRIAACTQTARCEPQLLKRLDAYECKSTA